MENLRKRVRALEIRVVILCFVMLALLAYDVIQDVEISGLYDRLSEMLDIFKRNSIKY